MKAGVQQVLLRSKGHEKGESLPPGAPCGVVCGQALQPCGLSGGLPADSRLRRACTPFWMKKIQRERQITIRAHSRAPLPRHGSTYLSGKAVQTNRATSIACPTGNRLTLTGSSINSRGLAFQSTFLRNFVDGSNENAMLELCQKIGLQLTQDRPLGTQNIASTIAFGHSLPRAMLPLYIVEDKEVESADGTRFIWKALIKSKHLTNPAADDKNVYCGYCPLKS